MADCKIGQMKLIPLFYRLFSEMIMMCCRRPFEPFYSSFMANVIGWKEIPAIFFFCTARCERINAYTFISEGNSRNICRTRKFICRIRKSRKIYADNFPANH